MTELERLYSRHPRLRHPTDIDTSHCKERRLALEQAVLACERGVHREGVQLSGVDLKRATNRRAPLPFDLGVDVWLFAFQMKRNRFLAPRAVRGSVAQCQRCAAVVNDDHEPTEEVIAKHAIEVVPEHRVEAGEVERRESSRSKRDTGDTPCDPVHACRRNRAAGTRFRTLIDALQVKLLCCRWIDNRLLETGVEQPVVRPAIVQDDGHEDTTTENTDRHVDA